jgi:hypothetical protein
MEPGLISRIGAGLSRVFALAMLPMGTYMPAVFFSLLFVSVVSIADVRTNTT